MLGLMMHNPFRPILNHLLQVAAPEGDSRSDGELLRQFAKSGDEAAFAELIQRYRRLVYGVCRRILRHDQDAEDAFQAVFLVLVRDVDRVSQIRSLPAWLYRVSCRIANHSRIRSDRARRRDFRATAMQPTDLPDVETWQEVFPLLDQEIGSLPQKYRMPVVLCYLQGQTQRQAAENLQMPNTTLQARLDRGLDILRTRLERRGVVATSASLTGILAAANSDASMSSQLTYDTAHLAALARSGGEAAVVSANIRDLMAAAPIAARSPVWVLGTAMACLSLGLGGLAIGSSRMSSQHNATGMASPDVVAPPATAQEDGTPTNAPPTAKKAAPKRDLPVGYQVVWFKGNVKEGRRFVQAEDKKRGRNMPNAPVRMPRYDPCEFGFMSVGEDKVCVKLTCEGPTNNAGLPESIEIKPLPNTVLVVVVDKDAAPLTIRGEIHALDKDAPAPRLVRIKVPAGRAALNRTDDRPITVGADGEFTVPFKLVMSVLDIYRP